MSDTWKPENLEELAGYISTVGVLTKYHPEDSLDIVKAMHKLGVLTVPDIGPQ